MICNWDRFYHTLYLGKLVPDLKKNNNNNNKPMNDRANVIKETWLVIPSRQYWFLFKYHGFGNGNNTDCRDSIVASMYNRVNL